MNSSYILLILVGLAIVAYLIIDAISDRGECSGIITYIARAIKRAWLRHNISGWERDIEHIQAQRANDMRAERVLVQELLIAKAQLRDLK